jgi:hypothetical protein
MNFDFFFVIVLLGPVVLLGVWATYRISTRKPKAPVGGTSRADTEERKELTGTEQADQRVNKQP